MSQIQMVSNSFHGSGHALTEAVSTEHARRKQSEEAIGRSEVSLAEVQSMSHTGSFGWNTSIREPFWSDEADRIVGVDKSFRPAEKLELKRSHTDDISFVQERLDRAIQDGTDLDFEDRLVMSDGSVRYIRVIAQSVENDEYDNVAASEGITEEALLEMQALKDQFRLVIDSIPALVWSTLPDGSADFLNQRWRAYTGLSSEEASGWGWRQAIHPEDLSRLENEWRATLADGTSIEIEARMRRFDGEYRWFLFRAVPLLDEERNIVKWYGTNTDIEDRKRAEETLRKTQIELAHVTRVMTMGEMVASIAHEIKQPLSAIVTNASACLRWLAREVPDLDEARETARRIIRDGNRASEILTRIHALLQKSDVRKTQLNINEAIQEVIQLTNPEAVRKGVTLKTELADDLHPVLGDRVQLQQVLLNLILNGIEAMVPVTDRTRELIVTSNLQGTGQVLISVRDCGTGIDLGDQEMIFDAFYTTKPHGLGMGLAISRSIVEYHGGRLWATQNDGPGVTFQFTIPRWESQTSCLQVESK